MPIRASHDRPFARALGQQSPDNPPFLNFSSTSPLSYTPSPETLHQASSTGLPHVSLETHTSVVSVPTPPTNASTPPDGSFTAAEVPWTTVVWFPPMSAGKTAAIVAATVVPVALIIVGALFLSRFLWRRETAKSSELAVAPRRQSTVRGGRWALNAGHQRASHTITTQSHQLSVETPATSPRVPQIPSA
ncbi:hypothetical protein B0J12DRAFT_703761 [Macrophomina phaseolina]|uniref:Uncharacterized protein n=1 Tax=Macrophomina phaseolina TaxID=35725 RepID=A0ABQ8FXI9_9PEZI|nr:hypothetical protein B0J12DRAFT_703761 [Macrophomina phaseolina]